MLYFRSGMSLAKFEGEFQVHIQMSFMEDEVGTSKLTVTLFKFPIWLRFLKNIFSQNECDEPKKKKK